MRMAAPRLRSEAGRSASESLGRVLGRSYGPWHGASVSAEGVFWPQIDRPAGVAAALATAGVLATTVGAAPNTGNAAHPTRKGGRKTSYSVRRLLL